MIIQAQIIDEFGDVVPQANVLIKGTRIGTITDNQGYFQLEVTDKPIEITHVSYNSKTIQPTEFKTLPEQIILEIQTLEAVTITATKPKKNILGKLFLGSLAFLALLKFAKASDEDTAHKKGKRHPKEKGLKGADGKNICTNRIKCKGIDKKTGKPKAGYYFGKGGKLIRKHKGLNQNGQLKKGYKYAKGGRIVKVNAKKGLKSPVKVTL